jgi:hypothetical protein
VIWKIPKVELQEDSPRQGSITRRSLSRTTLLVNIQLLILIRHIDVVIACNFALVLLRVVRLKTRSRTPPRSVEKEMTFWGKPGDRRALFLYGWLKVQGSLFGDAQT